MATTFNVTSCQGHKLYCEEHLPKGLAKGILVWHHGLGDHIARYTHFFQKVTEQDIAVYAFDAHSHGNSEPELRCMINNFDHLVDDVYVTVEEIKKRQSGAVPMFIGGQSMGGLVASHVALRQPATWSGLILASAAIDVLWTPVLRIQAKVGDLLAALVPKAQLVPAVSAEHMSQDPAVVKAFVEDKKIFHGNVRARTANQILKGMQRLIPLEAQLALPILAIHGTEDKTTALPAVKRLIANCSSTDKTLKEISGGYHELLMGPEKEEVIAAIASWIAQHCTAPAASTAPAVSAQAAAPAEAAAPLEMTPAAEAVPQEAAAATVDIAGSESKL